MKAQTRKFLVIRSNKFGRRFLIWVAVMFIKALFLYYGIQKKLGKKASVRPLSNRLMHYLPFSRPLSYDSANKCYLVE